MNNRLSNNKRLLPTLAVLTLFVLMGQGCAPGSSPADTSREGMTDGVDRSAFTDQEAPDDVFGISLPDNATDYRGPAHPDATEQSASFRVTDMTVEEARTHFVDAIPEAGWEVTDREENPISTNLYAASDEGEIDIILREDNGGVDVDMLLRTSDYEPLGT